jgi:hypothetical protein
MLSRCPHDMYNAAQPGDPSPYCTGCHPPGPLSKGTFEGGFDFCGVCGAMLDLRSELSPRCPNCAYEQSRLDGLQDLVSGWGFR